MYVGTYHNNFTLTKIRIKGLTTKAIQQTKYIYMSKGRPAFKTLNSENTFLVFTPLYSSLKNVLHLVIVLAVLAEC